MVKARALLVGDNIGISHSGWETPDRRTLGSALAEVGWRFEDVEICEPRSVASIIAIQRPPIVVALGENAARACIPAWEGSTMERRGYLFEGVRGVKTLATVSPELARESHVPWRILLATDLKRAREEAKTPAFVRPRREIVIIT